MDCVAALAKSNLAFSHSLGRQRVRDVKLRNLIPTEIVDRFCSQIISIRASSPFDLRMMTVEKCLATE